MNRSACFVCRESEKCYPNKLSSLKTRHSDTPILMAVKLIISYASTRSLDDSATLCFSCVDKINEYDEAETKMERIQRELNEIHEKSKITCNGAALSGHETDNNDDCDSDYSNYSLVSLDKTLQMPKCSICDQSFESYSNLNEHRQYCEKRTIKIEASEDESKPSVSGTVVDKEKPTCHICHKSYTTQQSLQMHMNSKTAHILRCKYCGVKFDDNHLWEEHEKRHKNRPKWQCVECDMILTAKGNLKKHMLVHTKEKLYQCDICGKEFTHDTSFRMHIRSHMNDRRSECYICKFRTLSGAQLRVHMRKHTGEKPHACEHCGKRFARPGNRNAHARLHFEPLQKPHKCTTCGAAFARIGKLTEHYQKIHGLQIQKTSRILFKVNPLPTK